MCAPADPGTVALLVPRLEDADSAVRAAACQALGRCRDVAAIPALIAHFGRGMPPESGAAAEALGSMPGQSLIALAPYLEDAEKVLGALQILEAARSPLFPDKIVELLDAPAAPVRRAALRVLVHHDEVDAEEHLVRKLEDQDESVRIEAIELLVRNGSTRAVPALSALLGVSDELRYHAIRALGRLRAEDAAPELERLFPKATGHERLEIVAALIRIGGSGLLRFLKERLRDAEPEVRRVAADGVARVAPAAELGLLVQLAQDPDWSIRNHAGWGLGRLGLPQGRDALLALVRDTEPVVARTARAALAKLQLA
jgi:HEAT repeat protein